MTQTYEGQAEVKELASSLGMVEVVLLRHIGSHLAGKPIDGLADVTGLAPGHITFEDAERIARERFATMTEDDHRGVAAAIQAARVRRVSSCHYCGQPKRNGRCRECM